jgi:autotransporter-associated beta strand protein
VPRPPLLIAAVAVLFTSASLAQSPLSYNTAATNSLTGTPSYTTVRVGVNGGTASTIVDATGTTSFTSNGSEFYVGVNTGTATGIGRLNLGPSNSITATQVTIGGAQPDNNGPAGNTGTVTTPASSTTSFAASNFAVGTGKGTGTFTLGSAATVSIGSTGARTSMVVGRWSEFNSHTVNGTANLSAGTASLYLSSLNVARITNTSGGTGSVCTGSMTLGTSTTNHLNVVGSGSVVTIASNTTTAGNGQSATGTLTINNLDAGSAVTSTNNATAILIASRAGSATYNATGTLNLNGGTLTITTSGSAIAGGGGPSTLEIGGGFTLKAGASSTTWIQNLTNARIKTGGVVFDSNGFDITVPQGFSATGTPAGGLTKAGVGRLTLSGANTYTGTTSVNAGVLDIASSGSISNSSPLTLSGGTLRYNSASTYTGTFTPTSGTLGGTNLLGSLGGRTIGAGLTLSPGNSPGTASTTSQTWAGGGTYLWEINSTAGSAGIEPGWDLLSGSNTLSISATSGSKFTLAITSLSLANTAGSLFDFDDAASYSWKIADFVNPVSGFDAAAFQIDTTGFANAFSGTFGVALGSTVAGGDNTEVYVTYVAVPEPATLGLLAAGGALAAAVARRRRGR